MSPTQTAPDYATLAQFRYVLRKFLRFSDDEIASRGITAQKYQALLFIKSRENETAASVGQLAEWLHVKSHSAAELASRMVAMGLIDRAPDPGDGRRTLLTLSEKGESLILELASAHQNELQRVKEPVRQLLKMLDDRSFV